MATFPSSVADYGQTSFHKTGDLCISALNGAITGSPGTFVITDAAKYTTWPTEKFVVRIDQELIYCTSRSGTTITIGARSFGGTLQADHTSGADVRVVADSTFLQALVDEIRAVQTYVLPGGGGINVADSETVTGAWTFTNASNSFVGNGAGLTGITGATGGVSNTGSTTIGADTDANGTGIVSLQTRNLDRVIISNDGSVGIGSAAPPASSGARLWLTDETASNAPFTIEKNRVGGDANITFYSSTGTNAAKTTLANGDISGRLLFYGYDGANYQRSAGITALVNGTVSAGVVPMDLAFYTSTTNTLVERMRITSAGNVGIGAVPNNPTYRFEVIQDSSALLARFATTSTFNPVVLIESTNAGAGGPALEIKGANGPRIKWNSIEASSTTFEATANGGASGYLIFRTAGSGTGLVLSNTNTIGIGTVSPEGTLHVFSASAGSVTASSSADELVIESSGSGGISILTPASSVGSIRFGSPTDNGRGVLQYNHASAGATEGFDFYTQGSGTPNLTLLATGHSYFSRGNLGIGISDATVGLTSNTNLAVATTAANGNSQVKIIGRTSVEDTTIARLSFMNNPSGTTYHRLAEFTVSRNGGDDSADFYLYVANAGTLNTAMRVMRDGNIVDGSTSMLVRRNIGGVFSLVSLRFGANGTGPGGVGRAVYVDA